MSNLDQFDWIQNVVQPFKSRYPRGWLRVVEILKVSDIVSSGMHSPADWYLWWRLKAVVRSVDLLIDVGMLRDTEEHQLLLEHWLHNIW